MGVAKERAEVEMQQVALMHGDEDDEEEEDLEEEEETEEGSNEGYEGPRSELDRLEVISRMMKEVTTSKRILLVVLLAILVAFVGVVPGRLLGRMYEDHILPNIDADSAYKAAVLTLRQRYLMAKAQQAHLRYLWTLKPDDHQAYEDVAGALSRDSIGIPINPTGPTNLTTLANESFAEIDRWRGVAEQYVTHGTYLADKERQELLVAGGLGEYYRMPESEVYNRIYMEVSQYIHPHNNTDPNSPEGLDATYVDLCKNVVTYVMDFQEKWYRSLLYGTQTLKNGLLADSELLIEQLRLLQNAGPLSEKAREWIQDVNFGRPPLLAVVGERQALMDIANDARSTQGGDSDVPDLTPFTFDVFLEAAVTALQHGQQVAALEAVQTMEFKRYAAEAKTVNDRTDDYVDEVYYVVFVPAVGFFVALITLPQISGMNRLGFAGCSLLTILALLITNAVVVSVANTAREDERALTAKLTGVFETLESQVMDSVHHLECWVLVDTHLALGTEESKMLYEHCFRNLKGVYEDEHERLKDVHEVAILRSKVHKKEAMMERVLSRLQDSEALHSTKLQERHAELADKIMEETRLPKYMNVEGVVDDVDDVAYTLFHLGMLRRRVPKDIINYAFLVGKAQGGWGAGTGGADNSTGAAFVVGDTEGTERLSEAKPQRYISHSLVNHGVALRRNVELLMEEHERVAALLEKQLRRMSDELPSSVVYHDTKVNLLRYSAAAHTLEADCAEWWTELTELLMEIRNIAAQHPDLNIIREYYLHLPRPSFRGEPIHEARAADVLVDLSDERATIISGIKSISWISVLAGVGVAVLWIGVWHVVYHDSWYTLQGHLQKVKIHTEDILRRASQSKYLPLSASDSLSMTDSEGSL